MTPLRRSCDPMGRAEFLALVLVSLMVLHKAEGVEMEDAMKEVAKRAHATGDDQLSAQVCVRDVVGFRNKR